MSNSIQINAGPPQLADMIASMNAAQRSQTAITSASRSLLGAGGMNGSVSGLLSSLGDLLKSLSNMLDAQGSGAGQASSTSAGSGTTAGGAATAAGGESISGTGRIWGDPHFLGQDGDKYDVQGEAGKTYNLLSDRNFQMNGRFDAFGDDGATVVGEVGISAGRDQIDVSKDGTVTVNGRELQDGDKVKLANGGSVKYDDGKVTVKSGEWTTDIAFEGTGDKAHLNIDVKTANALADGVKPHGLLGQTFDADDEARMGDEGKGAQGGGAIEGSNGNITAAGDKKSIDLYEVDDLHDRNFESFNQFFDKAEADPEGAQAQLDELVSSAFTAMSQMMMSQMMMSQMAMMQMMQQATPDAA